MSKTYNHTQAFAHFGTKPRNVQWSWSARDEATRTVVVTLWQDEFKKAEDGRFTYERGPICDEQSQKRRLGHIELMDNLRWALDHCDGRVKVIVAIAKDKAARPRSIAECFPSKIRARITKLDEASGEFGFEALMA